MKTYTYLFRQRIKYISIFMGVSGIVVGLVFLIKLAFMHVSAESLHGGGMGFGSLVAPIMFVGVWICVVILFGPVFIYTSFVKIFVDEYGFRKNWEIRPNQWSAIYEARINEYEIDEMNKVEFLIVKYKRGNRRKTLKVTNRMPGYNDLLSEVRAKLSKEANVNV